MAGTAVTDEWVNTHFEEGTKKLKNGLYIIFRVEGIDGIQNGFILKHYGVTDGNGDKLDLDNHGIVKSTNLEKQDTKKIKIDSNTTLKLGKEKDCTLSGMGFVKKGTEIRPFVDVNDGTGTDTKNIRDKLDNESTINNFFNHNIYDWFIKEKIRQHINANGGDGNDDDDCDSQLQEKFDKYKEETDKLLINTLDTLMKDYSTEGHNGALEKFITGNNSNSVNVKIIEVFDLLEQKSRVNANKESGSNIAMLLDKLKKINNSLSEIDGENYEEFYENLKQNDNVGPFLLSLIESDNYNEKLSELNEQIDKIMGNIKNTEKENLESLITAEESNIDMSSIERKHQIKLGGGYKQNEDAIKYTVESSITLNSPHQETEDKIEKITKLFNGDFRYILSIHTSYKTDNNITFVEQWRTWITYLQKNLKNLHENDDITMDNLYNDLLPFLFVDASYENKTRRQKQATTNEYEYTEKFTLMNTQNNGIIDMHPYYTNNANHLIQEFFKVVKQVDMGTVKGLNTAVNNMKVVHIADLIQIYNYMKKLTTNRAQLKTSYKFETITKSIANYFRDLENDSSSEDGENYSFSEKKETDSTSSESSISTKDSESNIWWKYIDDITSLSIIVNKELGLIENINVINDSKLMTFVKINNYSSYNNELDLKRWNLTYTPYISNENDSFLKLTVKNYNTDPTNVKKNFIFPDNEESRTYIFGGFSHVFKPNQAVESRDDEQVDEIEEMIKTKQTTNIINKITQTPNPEKVFIFGYGASGAGKTAMLVYNNKKKKDGYCIHLCKEIARKITAIKGIDVGKIKLTLNIHEFDNKSKIQDENTYFSEKTFTYFPKKNDENIDLTNLDDSTKERIQNDFNDDPYSAYYDNEKEKDDENYELKKKFIKTLIKEQFKNDFFDENYIPLVFYIRKYVTDESENGKRKIKTTRNNDQSSRSHIIIFIDFHHTISEPSSNTKYGSLIIADLAGVENPFDPYDPDTIIETYAKLNKDQKINNMDIDELERGLTVVNNLKLKGTKDSRKRLIDVFSDENTNYKPELNVSNGIIKFTNYEQDEYTYKFDIKKLKEAPMTKTINIKNTNEMEMIYNVVKKITKREEFPDYFDELEHDRNIKTEIITTQKELKKVDDYLTNRPRLNKRDKWLKYLNKTFDDDTVIQILNGKHNLQKFVDKVNLWPWPDVRDWDSASETSFQNKENEKQSLESLVATLNGRKYNAKDKVFEKELYNFYKIDSRTRYTSLTPEMRKLFYYYFSNRKKGSITLTDTFKNHDGLTKFFQRSGDNFEVKIKFQPTNIEISHSYIPTKEKKKEMQTSFVNDFVPRNIEQLIKFEYDGKSTPKGDKMENVINDALLKTTVYDETPEEYKNKVIDFCKTIKIHDQYNTDLKNEALRRKQRELQYVMKEVDDRYKEGVYINNQLSLLRRNMFDAMYHKCDGFLFTAPNINETCASSLCVPDDNKTNNCYLMETKKNTRAADTTDIFAKIQHLYQYQDINKMLKELNILVFTVFNITEKVTKVDDSGIQNPFNRDIGNKLYSNLEPTQFIDIEKIKEPNYLDKIQGMFADEEQKNIQHTSVKESAIRGELKKNIDTSEYSQIIEKLNTHNASTPLGTLFFTDNMSKFGKNSICHIQKDDDFNFVLDYVYDEAFQVGKVFKTEIERKSSDEEESKSDEEVKSSDEEESKSNEKESKSDVDHSKRKKRRINEDQ